MGVVMLESVRCSEYFVATVCKQYKLQADGYVVSVENHNQTESKGNMQYKQGLVYK